MQDFTLRKTARHFHIRIKSNFFACNLKQSKILYIKIANVVNFSLSDVDFSAKILYLLKKVFVENLKFLFTIEDIK